MVLPKNIQTSPTAKPDTYQPLERLTDSELQSMRKDFLESLQLLEKEEGIKLKHNFGEPLPPE